jgi:hypothetical protein
VSAGLDDKRQGYSVDAALIALAQARDQIGVPDHRLRDDRPVEPEVEDDSGSKMFATVKTLESVLRTHPAKPSEKATPGRFSTWGLIGLGALVPIGVVMLGWQLLYRQTDAAPASTSSVSAALSAKSATPSQKSSLVGQQKDAAVVSGGSPRLNLDQSVAEMARQVADSQQEIAELKMRQAQILSDNSDLDRRLGEAQELTHTHADLINDLKSAQTQMAQDNADLAAQVKASQEQVAKLTALLDAGAQAQAAKVTGQIKAGPDHNAALVEQNKRPKLSTPVSMRASNPPKRLAPKPRLQPAKPQSEDPAENQ